MIAKGRDGKGMQQREGIICEKLDWSWKRNRMQKNWQRANDKRKKQLKE